MSHSTFDERAATWDDDPTKMQRAEEVARAIREEVPLDGSMRMLEYGAGTGLLTQALGDAVGPVTLVDTSAGMRRVIENKIAAGIFTDARVWGLDLATDSPPDEFFDLIVTVMTLHHVPSISAALAGFARLLVDQGHLCIVDLEEEDGSFHGDDFDGPHGFDRFSLASQLTASGFADVSFRRCYDVVREHATYPLFLATCTRQSTDRGRT